MNICVYSACMYLYLYLCAQEPSYPLDSCCLEVCPPNLPPPSGGMAQYGYPLSRVFRSNERDTKESMTRKRICLFLVVLRTPPVSWYGLTH